MALGVTYSPEEKRSNPTTTQTLSQPMGTTLGSGGNAPKSSGTRLTINRLTQQSGFKTPEQIRPRRVVALVYGDWKQGKTHFALTAEPVIYFQSLDLGTEGVIEKFPSANIRMAEYTLTVQPGEGTAQQVADAAYQVWEQFKSDYYRALQAEECRTVVWDTESEVWELIRLANFGELNPKTGRDRGNVWGPINAEMLGLIRAAFGTDKNFIMLEKVKDEYANDKKTGRRERKGFGDAPFLAQLVAKATRAVGNSFQIEIMDCRTNPDANGIILPNDFNTVLEVVHG